MCSCLFIFDIYIQNNFKCTESIEKLHKQWSTFTLKHKYFFFIFMLFLSRDHFSYNASILNFGIQRKMRSTVTCFLNNWTAIIYGIVLSKPMTNCAQKRNPFVIKKLLVIFGKCSLNEKLIIVQLLYNRLNE